MTLAPGAAFTRVAGMQSGRRNSEELAYSSVRCPGVLVEVLTGCSKGLFRVVLDFPLVRVSTACSLFQGSSRSLGPRHVTSVVGLEAEEVPREDYERERAHVSERIEAQGVRDECFCHDIELLRCRSAPIQSQPLLRSSPISTRPSSFS